MLAHAPEYLVFQLGRFHAMFWFPLKMWEFNYHGGKDSCCKFFLALGPFEFRLAFNPDELFEDHEYYYFED